VASFAKHNNARVWDLDEHDDDDDDVVPVEQTYESTRIFILFFKRYKNTHEQRKILQDFCNYIDRVRPIRSTDDNNSKTFNGSLLSVSYKHLQLLAIDIDFN
jgi:hypothetical protein